MRSPFVFAAALVFPVLLGCGKKEDPSATPAVSASATPAATTAAATGAATAPASGATPAPPAAAPAGTPPPDGKYERVQVDGVTVPMIQVMEGGKVVLVDTDGAKPRTWEEQYKRKRDTLLAGQYDIHKTDADKDGKFDNDKIDKEGLWVIDTKGNITKH